MNTSVTINAVRTIEGCGVVSIVRLDDAKLILEICDALYAGGIRCFEIPMTARDASGIIASLRTRLPADAAIGAGTVLTAAGAERVIAAGAEFVVSPHFEAAVASVCKVRDAALIPGAFSPAEVYQAHTAGADIVKVFPIRAVGPSYLTDLLGPYPGIKLMPTGGITLENATTFIKAGACAVTVGRDVIGKGPWNSEAFEGISQRARNLVTKIAAAKGRSPAIAATA